MFLFTQKVVSSITRSTPRIQRTWHMTVTSYPPPTRPDFEETLQSKEDSEGCACCLHHLLLVGRVASELWIYIVKVIVITSNIYPETPPYCHDRHCLQLAYPESIREYFHAALEGEQAGQGGVHVVQHELVRVRLVVVLDTHTRLGLSGKLLDS